MYTISDDVLNRLARAMQEEGASSVYLFGSHARGDAGPDSDVDLAVMGVPAGKVLRAVAKAWRIAGCPVDIVDAQRESAMMAYLASRGEFRRVA